MSFLQSDSFQARGMENGRSMKLCRWFFWILLAASAAVRCILTFYPKAAYTYADELVYLELAQNIWRNGSLTLLNVRTGFSKILYPLLLSPFYAITNPETRSLAISVFNALLVSSSLVPAYLLGKRILKSPWQLCLALVVLTLAPECLFSLTYMAECLYIPMALWIFYFCFRIFEKGMPSPRMSLLCGTLLFLLYLTKESALAMAAGVLALYVSVLLEKETDKRKGALSLAAVCGSFLALFAAFRLAFFRGAAYSYAKQASFSSLDSPQSILFVLIAAAILLLFLLLSVFYFPVVYPLLNRERLDPPRRRLLLLTGVFTAAAAVGTAFGVSLYENFGTFSIRVHLRYFIPVLYPFLLLFLSLSGAEASGGAEEKPRASVIAAALVFIGLFFLLPQALVFDSLVDAPQLYAFASLGGDRFLPVQLLASAAVIVGTVLWLFGKRKSMAFFVLCLLLLSEAAGSVLFYLEARNTMEVPEDLSFEAAALDEYMDTMEGNILVIRQETLAEADRVLDTWSNDGYYVITHNSLNEAALSSSNPGSVDLGAGELVLSDLATDDLFPAYPDGDGSASAVKQIDWIVNCDPYTVISSAAAENVTPEGITVATVWRNQDPSRLSLLDPKSYTVGSEIPFYESGEPFIDCLTLGFSSREAAFTWTDGQEVLIIVSPNLDAPADLTGSFTVVSSMGAQRCSVTANDVPVFDDVISEPGVYSFEIPASVMSEDNYRITFRFLLPDAQLPGNGDTRMLGLALRSFVLTGDPLLSLPSAYDPGTPLMFCGESANAADYPISGFSDPEASYTWTNGKEAVIILSPQVAEYGDMYAVFTVADTLGSQRCIISANGVTVFDGVLTGTGSWSFSIPAGVCTPESPRIIFTFSLPDAQQPGNGDPRELALAFLSFILYE